MTTTIWPSRTASVDMRAEGGYISDEAQQVVTTEMIVKSEPDEERKAKGRNLSTKHRDMGQLGDDEVRGGERAPRTTECDLRGGRKWHIELENDDNTKAQTSDNVELEGLRQWCEKEMAKGADTQTHRHRYRHKDTHTHTGRTQPTNTHTRTHTQTNTNFMKILQSK